MRVTRERFEHWSRLTEDPTRTVFMSERVGEVVAFLKPYSLPPHPPVDFDVLLAMAAYSNMLDSRYYGVNGIWTQDPQ